MSDKTVAELMALHHVAARKHAEWCMCGGPDEKKKAHESLQADVALEQAIRRAVDSATLSAEPAQEMTDEQIDAIKKSLTWWNGSHDMTNHRTFARAVIAADRASRLPEMGQGDWPELPPPTFPADERSPDLWDVGVLRHIQRTAVEAYKALVRGKT